MEESRTVEFNGENIPVYAGKEDTHLLFSCPLKSKIVMVEKLRMPRDEKFLEQTKNNYDEWGVKYMVLEL